MKAFVLFLSLDLITKYIATIIEPDNSFFHLHYNTQMLFNIEGNFFVLYAFPLIGIPLTYYLYKDVSPSSLPLMLAGMVGNSIGRFLPCGVVDFINFQLFTNNLADIYMWIAAGILFMDVQSLDRKNKLNLPESSLQREII